MKKILSVILSLLMVLSVFSVSAVAADCKHDEILGGIVDVQPTCNSTGLRKVYCGVCQKYVYQTIPTVDHSWVWTIRPGCEPTINSTGIKDGICSVCGKTKTGVVVPKLDCGVHSEAGWEKTADWIITKDSTCTEKGKKQAWCTACAKYITAEVPLKEHNTAVHPHQAADCENNGHTEALYCNSCRSYIVYPQIIPAKGHNLFMPVADVEPTCTEVGKGTLICLNDDCEYTEQIEIEKISHSDADGDYFCDMCEARICKCICHKDNFIARFIRKLNTLLQQLLKSEDIPFRCCECMEPLAL